MIDRILATLRVLLTGRNIVIGAMVYMIGYGAYSVLGMISALGL